MGFKNSSNNNDLRELEIEDILDILIESSINMKSACKATGNLLFNNENKITNRLFKTQLEGKKTDTISFYPQTPENYNYDTDEYIGITDLRVEIKTSNRFNEKQTTYYTIECKRIDGDSNLNKQYVKEGVARFVEPPIKYPSPNNQNIMFGYLVKVVDVPTNIIKIETLQKKHLSTNQSNFILVKKHNTEYYIYSCQYKAVELSHLFYDFSDVIRQ